MKVCKYLVVVGLTVGEPLPLVVAVSKERLLALDWLCYVIVN